MWHARRALADTAISIPAGIWSAPGEGERLWTMGLALTTILIPGEAVAGRYSLMEFMVGRPTSPPLHTHPQDETFYMLEGALTMQFDEDRFAFEPGATAHIPAGLKHTWRADTETARWLVLSIPAGIEQLFRDLSTPATAATLPPPDAPVLSPDEIERVMAAHRHDNFGPPIGPDE